MSFIPPYQETAAILAAQNPLVPRGVIASETDTGVMKVGDGVTRYNSLSTALSGTYGRRLPNSIVLFGHSFISRGWVQNTAPNADYYDVRGAWSWASVLLRKRLQVLNVAGVSGDTLTQMIARMQTDVLAYNPGWVYLAGGINDPIAGRTASQIQADFQTIFDACKGIGARVVVDTLGPRSSNTSGQNDTVDAVNYWLLTTIAAQPGGHVVVNNWVPLVADITAATRAWTSTYTADNLHPNAAGAARIGRQLYTLLDPLVPQLDVLPQWPGDTKNLLANSFMAGTPGAGTAASWTTSGGTAAIVASTDQKTRQWQQMTSGSSQSNKVLQDITTGFSVADRFVAACEFSTDASPTSVTNLRLRLQALDSGFTVLDEEIDLNNGSVDTWPLENWPSSGVLLTPTLTIPASTARVRTMFDYVGQGVARVSRITLWKF